MACENQKCEKYGLHHDGDIPCFACKKDDCKKAYALFLETMELNSSIRPDEFMSALQALYAVTLRNCGITYNLYCQTMDELKEHHKDFFCE